MAKETGTLDLKALKVGHGDASTKATNYIEADSSGIKVHKQGDSNTYVQIISGAINFVRSGVNAMKLWLDGTVSKIRVGDENGKSIVINSSTGVAVMDGSDEIAGFGSTMHIGKLDSEGKYFYIDSNGNGEFLGAKLEIAESPKDPGAGVCTIKPHYVKVENFPSGVSKHGISLYASSSDAKIGLYDEQQNQWILYSLYFSGDPGTPENNTLYMSLKCKFNNSMLLANGTEIWDNTSGITHLLTPTDSSNKKAEFTFEPSGKIYRRTSTNGGSSWSSWTSIAG